MLPSKELILMLPSKELASLFLICSGTVWTAIAHIITWSVAQLGWILGPLSMVVFGIITIISSNLLCDCYRYPDPEVGPIRNRTYAEVVRSYLGKIIFLFSVLKELRSLIEIVGLKERRVCGWLEYFSKKVIMEINFIGLALGFAKAVENGVIKGDLSGVTTGSVVQKVWLSSQATILVTSFFFICCGCFGYAAFGEQAPGNLLKGFGFYEPFY